MAKYLHALSAILWAANAAIQAAKGDYAMAAGLVLLCAIFIGCSLSSAVAEKSAS